MTENQRLRDRIEELEFMLGMDRDLAMRIRHAWRITTDQSVIMAMMVKRSFTGRDTLYTILYSSRPDCDQPQPKIVDVQVCKLRQSMRRAGLSIKIETKWGDGYYITRADKAALMAALAEAETMPGAVPVESLTEELPAFLPARAA